MTGSSWLAQRLDISRWTAVLAVGDVIAIGAFITAGQAHHGNGNSLLAAMAPFLLGWLVVALIGGLYTHDVLLGPRRMLSWTVPAWLLGVLIALVLRATSFFPGNVTGLFPVVAVIFGGLLVIGWRTVASIVLPRPE